MKEIAVKILGATARTWLAAGLGGLAVLGLLTPEEVANANASLAPVVDATIASVFMVNVWSIIRKWQGVKEVAKVKEEVKELKEK